MSRLICISNRVGPLNDTAQAGGLAVGLVDALKERGGTWFGWSGEVTETGTFGPLRMEEQGKVQLATIDITQVDNEEFYAGYTNRTLWPLFHYRLDIADFHKRFEDAYRRVNNRFAERVKPLIGASDIVWAHDYHFLPLGAELRRMEVTNPIGFFLHTPFPPPEILTALPRSQNMIRDMMAYDLIGFQTDLDRRCFVRYVVEELGGSADEDGRVHLGSQHATATVFPIGIDAGSFAKLATTDVAKEHGARLQALLAGRRQIIGVDRLDYSKGIPERFLGFERLLQNYPTNRGGVSFMQIAPLSRAQLDAYADLRHHLESELGRINGAYADFDWTPIRFLTRGFTRQILAGLYRASAVGLVSPLRDGMNLVAKEYVAAQDPEDPGVLVLSRFAGAAEQMKEALIVNPYNIDSMADALQTAIDMPLDQRKERWQALNTHIHKADAKAWCAHYLSALDEAAMVRATNKG